MRFINTGEPKKFRTGNHVDGYAWITLQKGQEVNLPERVGREQDLEEVVRNKKVTEGKAGPKKVETKQFEDANEKQ